MIPHIKSLTKFVNFNEISKEVLNVRKTLAKNIGEACERRLYTNNNNLKLNYNKIKVTTAVYQRCRLSAYAANLKNNLKEQLKLKVKKHVCFEANQDGESSILPPYRKTKTTTFFKFLSGKVFNLIIKHSYTKGQTTNYFD